MHAEVIKSFARDRMADNGLVRITKIDDWAFPAVGVYLNVSGLTSKMLINEAHFPATKDERNNAKATPLKRLAVAGAGLVACVYAAVRLFGK